MDAGDALGAGMDEQGIFVLIPILRQQRERAIDKAHGAEPNVADLVQHSDLAVAAAVMFGPDLIVKGQNGGAALHRRNAQ